MNINKFTQKSMQAVNDCERVSMEYGNQEIEQEHLLYALLTQEDSLILKLMEKMGIDKNTIVGRTEEALRKRTKVQGGQQYIACPEHRNSVWTQAPTLPPLPQHPLCHRRPAVYWSGLE